jgi:hypothetical protein
VYVAPFLPAGVVAQDDDLERDVTLNAFGVALTASP